MDASPDTQTRSPAQKILVALPYTWLVAFFLVPFLIVFKISFSKSAIAVPPYTPLFHLEAGWRGIQDFLAAFRSTIIGCLGPIRSMCCPM